MAGPVLAGAFHSTTSAVVGVAGSWETAGASGLAGGSSTSVTSMATFADASAAPSLTLTVTV